jgi:enoyl-CoA hydratase
VSLLDVQVADRVATLTLNDPDRRNALSLPMVDELVQAFDALEADDGVGAVVVTGAGSAFCAGAALGDLATAQPEDLRAIYAGFLRVAECPLPTLAAVNGAAVGAGINMALACDVRVAARRARFDTRFMDLGLHPGGGHTWLFQRITGPQPAAAAILFGQVLDATESERVGLVWRCVEDADLLAEAHRLAARAAEAPRELAIATKATMRTIATVATHAEAVEVEVGPQVWSTRQPFMAERLAKIQARISKR